MLKSFEHLASARLETSLTRIRNSGYGRELGNTGIQEFVNKRLVRVANLVAPV